MKLSPRELDHLVLCQAGGVAQRRLARGLRLNHPETVALVSTVLMELVRDGKNSVVELMQLGGTLLGFRQVMPGVPDMIHEVQIEATFPDGTKLITVHNPIRAENGDLSLALYGSGLSPPALDEFPTEETTTITSCAPGEILVQPGEIILNEEKEGIQLRVTNKGDRAIQVGSHYHFVETNPMLEFDRKRSLGFRLNIIAGTAIRFEPGEAKVVPLVKITGRRVIQGGNGLLDAECIDEVDHDVILSKATSLGFLSHEEADEGFVKAVSPSRVSRDAYVQIFGPTKGDKVHLGDTGLIAVVERDLCAEEYYGDEVKFGGGKVIRDGMGQCSTNYDSSSSPDLVFTNALVVDWTGIFKADVGVKDGRIVAIGKAGNPDIMDGVHPKLIVTPCTEIISAEGKILTAGGVDTHVHYICPQIADEALASGVTTLYGGGTGPASGTNATTCTSGKWNIKMMLESTDVWPLNFGFSGKGNASEQESLKEQILAGASGLKLHEDWGTTPKAIDTCLTVADEFDVQISIHTDTLNESGFVEQTIAAFKGRTIHSYHTEGAGGGHAPDIISVVEKPNVLPSSTNPTRPYSVNTVDEHLDMLMVCHHLDPSIPEDVSFAESRIRAETIQAEDLLHDMGALSMISSDSQAMGRVGESIIRTWQTASKMKCQLGRLPEEPFQEADNLRIKRYVSKYTINPAITHGMAEHVGSVEVGKLADLCLWDPRFFGAKPELVVKGGGIVLAQMGDPNASIPTPEPVLARRMFGGSNSMSIAFVSKVSLPTVKDYRISKNIQPVTNCRAISKSDLKWNSKQPQMRVDPETFQVTADGQLLRCEPVKTNPLAQKYFLF
ncbi:hypothetical protein NDN08_005805 [Rhodosorus marinus]|uniref:Urease n=1 Tax=Rhodosorus marinus TaxID=101924 RepID=A0AAV8V2N7_9RHOD|nr:hypothetical protein NDN08_005805 [Rhodosorus marinus]